MIFLTIEKKKLKQSYYFYYIMGQQKKKKTELRGFILRVDNIILL